MFMLRRNNRLALPLSRPPRRTASRRLAKFADELSGTRHFNVTLYPIEGHLA
jgi:hypothetical protein